ncbi:hypothetical protein E4U41_007768 [Claviceps citrina]|nr:hypothetical protein E4U41_007768 [Claviceps citrina]
MPPAGLSSKVLMLLVASYAVTNLILIIMSLVAYHRAKMRVSLDAHLPRRIDWNMAASSLYPLIAAAATVCFLTASIMLLNMLAHAKKAALDPLYVFRGVLVTLLVLTPVVVMGWIRPSAAVSARPRNGTLGTDGTGAARESHADGFLHHVVGTSCCGFVGLTGTFLLRAVCNLPGASTVLLSHFNVLFGAIIAGASTAMAPPTGF